MTDGYYTPENFRPCTSAGYLIKRIQKLVHARIEDAFSDSETSFTQWVAMALLNSGIATTATELARDVGHDAGAMTRIVDQMEARGLLTRNRDPGDRRIIKLQMTGEGRAQFEALTPKIISLWNDVFEGIAPGEIDSFIRMLNTLLMRLDPGEREF
jgi:DNA-binding MarR family transcriptional regulator